MLWRDGPALILSGSCDRGSLPLTTPQFLVFIILGAPMALLCWGRLRHDVVALLTLMACVLTALVRAEDAFSGIGHPAVFTVACVPILSRELPNTVAVDGLADARRKLGLWRYDCNNVRAAFLAGQQDPRGSAPGA